MEIRLISSNIRFDNPEDGEHSWENRRDVLAKRLLDFGPHLIGTQEGRQTQLRDLEEVLKVHNKATKGNYSLLSKRTWIKERMYPSIFYDQSELTYLEGGDIWLSRTPLIPGSFSFKSSFPRLATWGVFEKEAIPFFYANLHLDHVLESTRIAQITVFCEEIKKRRLKELPLIIAGDFNDDPNSRVRKILFDFFPELFDPWIELKQKEQSSHHKFDGDRSQGHRIDWILLSKNWCVEEIFLDELNENGIYPSDHFPLKCRFRI